MGRPLLLVFIAASLSAQGPRVLLAEVLLARLSRLSPPRVASVTLREAIAMGELAAASQSMLVLRASEPSTLTPGGGQQGGLGGRCRAGRELP
jgi:hypothetical protein